MDPEISTMKTRPSFSQRSEATRSAERIWPEHAKHLEPSCTQGSEFRGAVPIPLRSSRQEAPGEEIIALRGIDPLPPLTVYVSLGRSAEDDRHIADYLEQLPYMSWMKYGDYLLTKDPHKQLTREGYAERQRYYLADFGTPQAVDGSRSWPMMTSPEVIANQKYPRRTLDQFYYPALHDTSVRDKDQTVSKWTGAALGLDGKEEAGTDSLLIMIDQFWCWIINKSSSCAPLAMLSIADYRIRHHINKFPQRKLQCSSNRCSRPLSEHYRELGSRSKGNEKRCGYVPISDQEGRRLHVQSS